MSALLAAQRGRAHALRVRGIEKRTHGIGKRVRGIAQRVPGPGRRADGRHLAAGVLLMAGVSGAATAAVQHNGALVGLINDYRASVSHCGGAPVAMVGPLAPVAALANAAGPAGGPLQEALQAAGYAASRSLAITLTGPDEAAAAMRLLAGHYCRELSSPRYSEIGVRRDGVHWRIVLAQPLLSPDLGSWREAGLRILELVNAARAEPRDCGDRHFASAPPLQWNARLGATALAHSAEMANEDYFAHVGEDGNRAGKRALRHGYDWRFIGENIAAGQGSPQRAVAGWLASPGHCANIMSGDFTEMGAAYAVERASTSTIYWTQVFGSSRETGALTPARWHHDGDARING